MKDEQFELALRRDGFDVRRDTMAPGTLVGEHAHPFDVRALVLNGEITLTVEGVQYAYREGDIFVLPAGHRHAEAVGPAGVDYLVGRRHLPAGQARDRAGTGNAPSGA
jgi:quercetin dioxygenase-like cupin family protein